MFRQYGSFLIRYWPGDGRIEIEHIQSGRRTRVPSLAAAADWAEECVGSLARVDGDKSIALLPQADPSPG